MLTCELDAPRHALAGEPTRVACRVTGADPRAEVRVEIWRTRPGRSRLLATIEALASATGEADGAAALTLDAPDGQLTPVTLVAHPFADGRAGAPDTEIVMVR